MSATRVTALMVLFAFAVVCFFSAPVQSIEYPWDADGGNQGSSGDGSGTGIPDTIIVIDINPSVSSYSPGSDPDWIGSVWFQITFWTVNGGLLYQANPSVAEPVIETTVTGTQSSK